MSFFAGASAPGAFIFYTKISVKDEEPNEMFDVVGNDGMRIRRLKIEKCMQSEELDTKQVGSRCFCHFG